MIHKVFQCCVNNLHVAHAREWRDDVLARKNKKREILRAGHATTIIVLRKLESFRFS